VDTLSPTTQFSSQVVISLFPNSQEETETHPLEPVIEEDLLSSTSSDPVTDHDMFEPSKTRKNRHRWTQERDSKLLEGVEKYGIKKWSHIAKTYLKNVVTGKQCRERYKSHLDPTKDHTPFSNEEIEAIKRLVNIYGRKWKKISEELPNRTEGHIKNCFHVQIKKIRKPRKMK